MRWQKILSSLGIGSTRIDLLLAQNFYRAGEKIHGVLRIESGIADQVINKIYLQLLVRAQYRQGDHQRQIVQIMDRAEIFQELYIKAGDPPREYPVSYQLPLGIPISTASTKLYLLTGLDISRAVDPSDSDPLVVLPDWRRETVMQALEKELGFRATRESGEYNGRFQQFEYKPTSFMRGKLDEIEVIIQHVEGGVNLFMEIDKKGSLWKWFELDERHVSCFLPDETLKSVTATAEVLARFIEEHYQHI